MTGNLISRPNWIPYFPHLCIILYITILVSYKVILYCVLYAQETSVKTRVSFSYWLFSMWTSALRQTFGSLSNTPCALENQEWPVHTATYLLKWSWHLINTCNPFLCRASKWDFKSSAKPHASRCVRHSSGGKEKGERDFLSNHHMHWIEPVMCCCFMSLWIVRWLVSQPILQQQLCPTMLDYTVRQWCWRTFFRVFSLTS